MNKTLAQQDYVSQVLDLPTVMGRYRNCAPAVLVELALRRGEGELTSRGALAVRTGKRTGRSPRDRYIVADEGFCDEIWWGPVNRPLPPEKFRGLLKRAMDYACLRELFLFDGWSGADLRHRLAVRIVTQRAWHSLFAQTLFRRPTREELRDFVPGFSVVALPDFHADPSRDGTASEACIAISFAERVVLIVGTSYAGEIKKAVFSVMNYLLPKRGLLPMHCSANIGPAGDTALFFGLSGTGKTTLSADPRRRLIGDDEHAWSDLGVFNLEGGCYAKTIRLSPRSEPQIWNALRFGSVLENVVLDPQTREVDFADDSITENTRGTYPVEYIDNCELSGLGGHPANIVFLTCDAFGVLPPISRLSHEQAVEHFLLGYTAKVAGTETGISDPQATFSPCFGGPFLPLPPACYGQMLQEKLRQHRVQVWLVNTGWSGGPAGKAERIPLACTRAMLDAALSGQLAAVPFRPDPYFGLLVPEGVPGVPQHLLEPRRAWPDPAAYDAAARRLADLFRSNMPDAAKTAAVWPSACPPQ
jgi:phosphoenolpyruvate carboxykinase (ATP)